MEVSLFQDVCDAYQSHLHSMLISNEQKTPARRGPSGGAAGVSGSWLNRSPYSFLGSRQGSFSTFPFIDTIQKEKQKLDNLQQNVCAEMFDLYKKYFDSSNAMVLSSPTTGNNNTANTDVSSLQQIVGPRICETIIERIEDFRSRYGDGFQAVDIDESSVNTDRSFIKKPVFQSSSNRNISYRDLEWQSPSAPTPHEYAQDNPQSMIIPIDVFDAAQKAIFQHMETFYYPFVFFLFFFLTFVYHVNP
ncbi:hypothetical protein RFI_12233 [Reticulomyxa filosa]|uniref:Uncharacterized protein n=1 Tax=Reticulomyxa filosa TaxID=46433 RepID=X6NGB4_RETFI|nr:hypothetical protein RFI_12233 [Reticulomyxa filosa]|eukprot:ETO24923.1 hypothetical protein RFI_12233 [Reticulomyxa filosa]